MSKFEQKSFEENSPEIKEEEKIPGGFNSIDELMEKNDKPEVIFDNPIGKKNVIPPGFESIDTINKKKELQPGDTAMIKELVRIRLGQNFKFTSFNENDISELSVIDNNKVEITYWVNYSEEANKKNRRKGAQKQYTFSAVRIDGKWYIDKGFESTTMVD